MPPETVYAAFLLGIVAGAAFMLAMLNRGR